MTPIPIAMAHVDGIINKTDKVKLLHKLEGMVESEKPGDIDVTLVNTIFLLNSLQHLPLIFGGLVKYSSGRCVRCHHALILYVTLTLLQVSRRLRGSDGVQNK